MILTLVHEENIQQNFQFYFLLYLNLHNNHFNPKRFKNNEFKIGDKVKHETYGYGTVLGVDYKTLQIVFREKKEIETLISDFVEKI